MRFIESLKLDRLKKIRILEYFKDVWFFLSLYCKINYQDKL